MPDKAHLPVADETLVIASDHGGYELKQILLKDLEEKGFKVLDLGTHSPASCNYPDFAHAAADALRVGKAQRGVLVCGSGIGISMAANRHAHVRAALVHDALGARLCREHNNANIIVFGGRTTGIDVARDCLNIFLNTPFEGGRHEARVAAIELQGHQ